MKSPALFDYRSARFWQPCTLAGVESTASAESPERSIIEPRCSTIEHFQGMT